MRSRRTRPLLAGMLLCGLACLAEASPPITVSARIADEGRDPILEFVLQSHADYEMRVPGELLPWRSPAYTVLVLVDPRSGGRPLEDRHAVLPGITGGEAVTLPPRQSISGRVNLSERYPQLTRLHRETDVAVFWSYQVPVLGQGNSDARQPIVLPWAAGGLVLAKAK